MYKYIILASLILGVAGYGYYSYNQLIKLSTDNRLLTDKINTLTSSIEKQEKELKTLNDRTRESLEKSRQALEPFEDSDLKTISERKPELIEKIINRGTKKVLRELEDETRVTID